MFWAVGGAEHDGQQEWPVAEDVVRHRVRDEGLRSPAGTLVSVSSPGGTSPPKPGPSRSAIP